MPNNILTSNELNKVIKDILKMVIITPEYLASSGSESSHQKALFCFFALPENQKRYPDVKYMFAIPNGGARTAITGARLKAEGVKPGVPDILLPLRRKYDWWYSGLFIEMKKPTYRNRKDGGISVEQTEYIAFLSLQGFKCVVCYTWEEARDEVIKYYGHNA